MFRAHDLYPFGSPGFIPPNKNMAVILTACAKNKLPLSEIECVYMLPCDGLASQPEGILAQRSSQNQKFAEM